MTDALIALAVESSVRAALLVAAVALVLALLRVGDSAIRHSAWRAALVAMLAMPLLATIDPPLAIPLPGAIEPIADLATPAPRPIAIAEPGVSVPRRTAHDASAEAAVRSTGAATVERPTWQMFVAAAYGTGLAVFLLRLALGFVQLRRIRRTSRPIALEGSAPDEVLESPLIAVPVAVGVFSPRVIVPVAWREWSIEMRSAVIAHERAHVARRDPLVALLAGVNAAVFWFHPAAWWLRRALATTAELACDAMAVRETGDRRVYAETLVAIAGMARAHRGRLTWPSTGAAGEGRLERRIDRVLDTARPADATRQHGWLVAASCAAVMMAAVACSPQAAVPPLREDPELAAQLPAQQARAARARAAREMSLAQAVALESALAQRPDDMTTRETLLAFYAWTGDNPQAWHDNVAARRRHVLWLAEHRPESDLVMQVRLSRQEDPDGYARARALWLARTAGDGVGVRVLGNAAWFLAESDAPLAEPLLLRARARQPDASWTTSLGALYAAAILEDAAYGRQVRERLETTTDADVLLAAARSLVRPRPTIGGPVDGVALGRRYAERAAQRETTAAQARELLRELDASAAMTDRIAGDARVSLADLRARPANGNTLRRFAALAESEYLNAEYDEWRARQPAGLDRPSGRAEENLQKAVEGFALSKQAAREALDLGDALRAPADATDGLFRAHIASGLHAFRDGNRALAVRHLLDASRVPAPKDPWPEPRSLLEHRLVNALLKHGERETIVEYYERASAGRSQRQRRMMLDAAAAIRAGRMPEPYQRLLANGRL